MPGFTVDLQLDVDTTDHARAAFDWMDQVSRHMVPAERDALAGLPARTSGSPRPGGPLGSPGDLFGIVTVTRWGPTPLRSAERACSDAGLTWLRRELADPPRSADLWIGHLDERGHRSGHTMSVSVIRCPESPRWLRLHATVPEQVFLDADTGRASQRRWLQAVRSHADRLNPGFGHVAYSYTNGATALENSLPPRRYRREERDPTFTVGACRQFLRGYSWLTVVPEQLAARLPGVDELRDGGAFVEVEPLENGGLWLLATEDYRGYDEDAVGRVFTALAPVLRRGTPARQPRYPGEPPYPIVFEDAATRTAPPR